MRFEVYCDEAYPDLFSSRNPQGRYLVIGSLWLPSEVRDEVKAGLQALRNHHLIGDEFKWQKVTPSKLGFYLAVVEQFFSLGDRLRFRCIAVDRTQVDLVKFHESDHELGFYKFYYQMLRHWLLDFNDYAIYCDTKTTRVPGRLATLHRCLAHASLSSTILRVQAVPSEQSLGIQFADVLTGAVAAKLNRRLRPSSAKSALVASIENHLGRPIHRTHRSEKKFNVFVINLQGGW